LAGGLPTTDVRPLSLLRSSDRKRWNLS